jgi:Cu/Ag efflux protein CusF
MRVWLLIISVLPFGLWMLVLFNVPSAKSLPPATSKTVRSQFFSAKGVVQSVNREDRQFVIRHEAVSNYMAAKTMPFNSNTAGVLAGLPDGDEMAFELRVAETDSRVEQICRPFISFVRVT